MYPKGIMVINSIRICSIESIWTIQWNSYGPVPWNPLHSIWNPYGIDHSMISPHGIHDVHGTMIWLWSQPTLIPWIPDGIPDVFHGFQVDSICIIPGKVKTSSLASWGSLEWRKDFKDMETAYLSGDRYIFFQRCCHHPLTRHKPKSPHIAILLHHKLFISIILLKYKVRVCCKLLS